LTDNNCAINEEKCPEIVPEEQTGMTKEEQEWGLKKEPRPPLPRYVFGIIAALILIIFLGGSLWITGQASFPKIFSESIGAFQTGRILGSVYSLRKSSEAASRKEKHTLPDGVLS
jgi:hypothetical protein